MEIFVPAGPDTSRASAYEIVIPVLGSIRKSSLTQPPSPFEFLACPIPLAFFAALSLCVSPIWLHLHARPPI